MDLTNLTDTQKTTVFKLVKSFAAFNLHAKFVDISIGPVVTGYYFNLTGSTQISSVYARREDIALALGVDSVNIARTESKLVVYVPNAERNVVEFKNFLHWYMHDPLVQSTPLPIPLGITPTGINSILALPTCPHILIAGQTGSGKSVFESAIITCLVARYSSDELKLCLVDTKQVDLPLFSKLPHVLKTAKSSVEYFDLMGYLYKICKSRLAVLSHNEVRNIEEYHIKVQKQMPYIVLMIDEFANLLDEDNAVRATMSAAERRETPSVSSELKTLAQISRAAGIHIIACTQRSSVKIVSGDIKVNLPCRIALKLPSAIDSRTILDESGAESLLGQGDMLVKQPGHDLLQRYHGPFVRLSDISYIIQNLEQVKEYL